MTKIIPYLQGSDSLTHFNGEFLYTLWKHNYTGQLRIPPENWREKTNRKRIVNQGNRNYEAVYTCIFIKLTKISFESGSIKTTLVRQQERVT